jgi:HTH-type transcriptional regulator/antitoxin HigA
MIKRGWIEESDAALLKAQLARFFDVSSPDQIPYLAHAAKKTSYEEREITPEQLAWLFRVKQIAKSISVPKYSEGSLRESLARLKTLLYAPEEACHAPRILMECGVRFVIVETLPKSKIDGVCFWLDAHSPVIGMSIRFDRIDNFWFVLRHEIDHVLRQHGQEEEVVDAELEGDRAGVAAFLPTEERMANAAAADFCVPQPKLDSFIARKRPFFYEKDVLAFSRILNVHPGLVVGQMQRRLDRWDYLRKYQVKIRHAVLPGAIADGWGQVLPFSL